MTIQARFKTWRRLIFTLAAAAATFLLLIGCRKAEHDVVQGYVEGEFVYVASPLAGALETLNVQKGAQAKTGELLFTLESGLEKAAREQAARRLAEGRANLADARKGKREPEIEALAAQFKQANAALALAEKEFNRQTNLFKSGSAAAQEFDRARSTLDQDRERVSQLEADLRTAKLGLRTDQIIAAEANVLALEAALATAEWNLAQKSQSAPQDGLVFDTLYRAGEWVAAGRPIIALLPPPNIKVRAFVPELKAGGLRIGDRVRVTVDGVKETFTGAINFISPKAEYTPPVIYSRESREKLVFMVEVSFEPVTAARLHPGQPVEVKFGL
ncbi:MAG: Multidrug resistance efflux pump [Chthoniobacteraceae bacterium]|nr:Multidrug resistance efflux pump [Chthoniobacteraceae bacterium]